MAGNNEEEQKKVIEKEKEKKNRLTFSWNLQHTRKKEKKSLMNLKITLKESQNTGINNIKYRISMNNLKTILILYLYFEIFPEESPN